MQADSQLAAKGLRLLSGGGRSKHGTRSYSSVGLDTTGHQLPLGGGKRLWIMGASQARIVRGYLRYGLRKHFVNDSRKQQLRNEANLQAALELLATMSYLRGAFMKFGQLLAQFPHLVPAEFVEILSSLHFEAPAMHYTMVREVFVDEFGREPKDVFATFDREAFAAASLGQVHRARLKSGEQVAVKIQYPGIGNTITADIRNLRGLLQPMRLQREWQYMESHLNDFEKVLLAEVDYDQEARFQHKVRQLFSDDRDIVVPALYHRYCGRRVLTMEYLPGCHLKEFMASGANQEQLNRAAGLISRAILRIWFQSRTVYPDVHPGNFLFMADGRLGLLDFGNHRTFTSERWFQQNLTEQAYCHGDKQKLLQGLASSCFYESVEDVDPQRLDYLQRTLDWIVAPIQTEGIFDFGSDAYYDRGIKLMLETFKKGYQRYDSFYNWTTRSFLSFRSLLYQLGGDIDFHTIWKQELAEAQPVTVDGIQIPLASLYRQVSAHRS